MVSLNYENEVCGGIIMPKFFADKSCIDDHTIVLDGENANHICAVLRCRTGDEITVCDGEGTDYICRLTQVDKKQVIAEVTDICSCGAEPKTKIRLYQGLPKADKMELIIQKCVEIGIDSIVPVETQFSVVKLSGKEDKKLARWNKIAQAAAKQCGRGKVPVVEGVMTFDKAVEDSKTLDGAIIPYEREKDRGIRQFVNSFKGQSVGIFIGPEGGFSKDEVELAIQGNAVPVTLGKRILRTETAGLVTGAILLYELE